MNRYCTECNSITTPSLVGYLCPECGNVQRFYSATDSAMLGSSLARVEAADTSSADMNVMPSQLAKLSSETKQTYSNNKVKSMLKRLVVPELAPPHQTLIDSGSVVSPSLNNNHIGVTDQTNTINNGIENTREGSDRSDLSQRDNLEATVATQKDPSVWTWIIVGILIFVAMVIILLTIIQN